MNLCRAGVVLLLATALTVGCGSDSGNSDSEAQKVVQQLRSLKKGEILIQGTSAPRIVGPYDFKPGGYIFSFEQKPGDGKLSVALESKPRSHAQPYKLLVDSGQPAGSTPFALAGRLYVHIRDAGGEYILRFRPDRR
jgi:hypothetical protein